MEIIVFFKIFTNLCQRLLNKKVSGSRLKKILKFKPTT